ncbi:hypothetical protein Tco_0156061 [Tanacetum coccineum]
MQGSSKRNMLVPFTERVKISSTNIRLETTVPQKEETFQVVIDLIKNSTCFKASTISVDKCVVDADVFKKILDICPRVKGVSFTDVPDDDTALTFLIELGYKGPLYKHTNMFVDHMHQPWRTLATIINKCLSGKTTSNGKLRKSKIDILLKFVRIGEDYQEYRLHIPDVMLTDAIKQSESYQMFIKYSTGQIPPKKSRGKGSQGKKTADTQVADVVLAKSIIKTEAEEAEAARQVHATHARIMTESVTEPTRRRKSSKVTSDPPKKLKGVPSLTPEEQEVADTMQALKESKKSSRRQPGTRGSNEGTGTIPGVFDESTVISATSSEGTGTKPGVPDEENDISEEQVILEWGSEQESEYSEEDLLDDEEKDDIDDDADNEGDDHISDTQDADDEDDETE